MRKIEHIVYWLREVYCCLLVGYFAFREKLL